MTDTDMPSSPGSDKYARQDGDDDETYELLLQLKELRCARLQALIDLKEVRGRAVDFILFIRTLTAFSMFALTGANQGGTHPRGAIKILLAVHVAHRTERRAGGLGHIARQA